MTLSKLNYCVLSNDEAFQNFAGRVSDPKMLPLVMSYCMVGSQIFLDIERDGRVEEWSHLTLPKYAGQVMPDYVALRQNTDGELDMWAAGAICGQL